MHSSDACPPLSRRAGPIRLAPFRLAPFLLVPLLLVPVLVVIGLPAAAQALPRDMPGRQCDESIRIAARTTGNPADLMTAIGLVESGRPDASGTAHPWPWTINAEGKGMFFESKAEAIATVRLLQANGVRSIDVGCMQVNLMHHPDAFSSLDEAFDPRRNALYAGRFLGQLFQQSRNWLAAAGLYHSGTPSLAADYVKAVSAVLRPGTSTRFAATSNDAPARSAPVIGRDGTIVPSVRLTAAGLVGQSSRTATVASPARLVLSRWNLVNGRARSSGS